MKVFFKRLFIFIWLIASTAWVALAVTYGDSSSGLIQSIIAIILTLIGGGAVIVLFFIPSWGKRFLLFHTITFFSVLVWWFNIAPSNDRVWQADVKKLSFANVQRDLITVHNIRNFSYQSEFEYETNYYNKTFDLNKLEGADLLAAYWMGPAIAHIIMSFDFGNNNRLAISIEARKEEGEGYSTIKGFFRQYELIYVVADEKDIVDLRTHYRTNPPEQVYRYRLNVPKENVKRMFLEYIHNINILAKEASFYNTLVSNCASVIWMHSRVNPDHLPFSWKILLSGYVPEYLYESGRLDLSMSFLELRKLAYINSAKEN